MVALDRMVFSFPRNVSYSLDFNSSSFPHLLVILVLTAVVPSYELVSPVHRLVFQERGNYAASGMLPAIPMRIVRRKSGRRVPSERRTAHLRRSDTDGGGPFSKRRVSRAQPSAEEKDSGGKEPVAAFPCAAGRYSNRLAHRMASSRSEAGRGGYPPSTLRCARLRIHRKFQGPYSEEFPSNDHCVPGFRQAMKRCRSR